MVMPQMPTPLLGVLARTERGRSNLRPEALIGRVDPTLGTSDPSGWWVDPAAGLALWRPELSLECPQTRARAVLSIRGSIQAEWHRLPPGGWPGLPPAEGAMSVLYDLLDRDSSALADLRGPFALAVWDGRRRRLL